MREKVVCVLGNRVIQSVFYPPESLPPLQGVIGPPPDEDIPPHPGLRDVRIDRPNKQTSFGFVLQSNTLRPGCMICEYTCGSHTLTQMYMYDPQSTLYHVPFHCSLITLLSVGRLVPGSPAEMCQQLYVNDELLAVNGQDVSHMDHSDIVSLIKSSDIVIHLTVQQPDPGGKDGNTSHSMRLYQSCQCIRCGGGGMPCVTSSDRCIHNWNNSYCAHVVLCHACCSY